MMLSALQVLTSPFAYTCMPTIPDNPWLESAGYGNKNLHQLPNKINFEFFRA